VRPWRQRRASLTTATAQTKRQPNTGKSNVQLLASVIARMPKPFTSLCMESCQHMSAHNCRCQTRLSTRSASCSTSEIKAINATVPRTCQSSARGAPRGASSSEHRAVVCQRRRCACRRVPSSPRSSLTWSISPRLVRSLCLRPLRIHDAPMCMCRRHRRSICVDVPRHLGGGRGSESTFHDSQGIWAM
jgi:hypothetical protein